MHRQDYLRLHLVNDSLGLFAVERESAADRNRQNVYPVDFLELFVVEARREIPQMAKSYSLAFKDENSVGPLFRAFFFVVERIDAFDRNAFDGVFARNVNNGRFALERFGIIVIKVIVAHCHNISLSLRRPQTYLLVVRIGENHHLLTRPAPLRLGRDLKTSVSVPLNGHKKSPDVSFYIYYISTGEGIIQHGQVDKTPITRYPILKLIFAQQITLRRKEVMQIPRVSLSWFHQVTEEVFARFLTLPENPAPERKGCYICLMDKSGRVRLLAELGTCDPEKAKKYLLLSQEKALRLLGHEHISSWQSRDYDNDKYGGAITAPPDSLGIPQGKKFVVSISGLPEFGDEAVSLVTASLFHWVTIGDIDRIIAISGNPLAHPLVRACADLYQ